jgi:integrase/recombinase XerD
VLDLYRRHVRSCPQKPLGRGFTRCNCPVWVDGSHPDTGKRVQRSVGTRDWSRAVKLLERWDSDNSAINSPGIPALEDAIAQYIADCRRRGLAPGTVHNYERTLGLLAASAKVQDVSGLTVQHLRDFSASRADRKGRRSAFTSGRTLRKELEHLRAFCAFCVDNQWIGTNPARGVKMPKDVSRPTLPFSPEEVRRLIAAVDDIDNNYAVGIERARVRAKGLVLLLLYSGLRVGDAVQLKRERLGDDGRLLLRMEKTGAPLYVRLPPHVISALRSIPVESGYFFWSGKSELATAVGSARRTIACLASLTGIPAHPHRFRDTFSVELLKSGADLFTVQKLLGHTSIKTTEKHYSPWVLEMQRGLDRATARLKFG